MERLMIYDSYVKVGWPSIDSSNTPEFPSLDQTEYSYVVYHTRKTTKAFCACETEKEADEIKRTLEFEELVMDELNPRLRHFNSDKDRSTDKLEEYFVVKLAKGVESGPFEVGEKNSTYRGRRAEYKPEDDAKFVEELKSWMMDDAIPMKVINKVYPWDKTVYEEVVYKN